MVDSILAMKKLVMKKIFERKREKQMFYENNNKNSISTDTPKEIHT